MSASTAARRGRLMRPILTAALLVSVASGVGCKSKGPKAGDLVAENEELRARESQLQAALDDAEGRVSALSEERDRLSAELARAGTSGAGTPFGDTGFEGIDGTTTSRRGSDIVVDVAGDVLFASGSVTLKNDAKATLDRIASTLNSSFASNEIRIAGHTDSDPIRKSKWQSNERLSAERALAVEEYLASRGVSKDRMHIAGYGPAKSKGTKASSRRVEIVILGG
jgi:outer membrane protein OmpA-like peptidoglycan-associated protein